MAATNTPQFWTFLLANIFVLSMGAVLTILSIRVHRRSGKRPFRFAAIGFFLITVGGIGDAIYELAIRETYQLVGRQLLILHTAESLLIGLGLASLFYSLYQV